MTLERHINNLNQMLTEKQPSSFNPTWIIKHVPSTYQYFFRKVRNEVDEIDWDSITHALDREFQKRWTRRRGVKVLNEYENQEELNLVLNKYKDKLYTFIAPIDENDREIRNRIIISLVRIAQKGNVLAKNELIKWVTYVVESWLERYYQIFKWKGYPDEVEDKIRGCIRCYR